MYSIIILVYNNAEYLRDCLQSISCQSYKDYELIIMDDHSIMDETKMIEELIEELFDESVSYSVNRNEKNLGTVRSINRALDIAKGNYIKLIAADDCLYDADVLEKVAKSFDENYKILISRVASCNEMLEWNGKFECDEFQRSLNTKGIKAQKELTIRNKIAAQGVFFRKSFFDKWGKFDERYRLLEDWPTWLRILRGGEEFQYIDVITVKYRSATGVVSNANPYYLKDRKNCCIYEVLHNYKHYGIVCSIGAYFMAVIFSNAFIRKIYSMLPNAFNKSS